MGLSGFPSGSSSKTIMLASSSLALNKGNINWKERHKRTIGEKWDWLSISLARARLPFVRKEVHPNVGWELFLYIVGILLNNKNIERLRNQPTWLLEFGRQASIHYPKDSGHLYIAVVTLKNVFEMSLFCYVSQNYLFNALYCPKSYSLLYISFVQ